MSEYAYPKLNKAKILVVDDEDLIRDTISTHLELEGAVVTQAADGLEAYKLVLNNNYDLILTDIRMPKCSGVELLEKIRGAKIKTAPVVFMSAFTDISQTRAKELGAKGMFAKPENINFLKEMLVDALDDDF